MSIFISIYICNTFQYSYFCRKFAEMGKGKKKGQQSSTITKWAYVIRYTCKIFDIRDAHGKLSKKNWIQIYQFWNLYCNTVESFARLKICKMLKFCMNELLQIATNEKFCEANFREHQNFISFNFTNKLRLPTWILDVIYYFEW